MKRFLILFPLCLFAADIVDIGEITDRKGIRIYKCHEEDASLIEVITKNSDKERHSGYFSTTNATIFRNDVVIPMIPPGTNLFIVRTLCAGSTSEVNAVVRFVIRRPIPAPVITVAELFPSYPPMPPGALMPLPGGRIKNER